MQPTENPVQPSAPKVVLEEQLETYLIDKAPFQIPDNIRAAIVKYVPWITLILMIMFLPVVLFALGIGAVFAPVSVLGGVSSGFTYMVSLGVTVVMLVLQAVALPGLFNRKRSGWVYSYYGALLGAVLNVLDLSVFGLLFSALYLFILFQVRDYYK